VQIQRREDLPHFEARTLGRLTSHPLSAVDVQLDAPCQDYLVDALRDRKGVRNPQETPHHREWVQITKHKNIENEKT